MIEILGWFYLISAYTLMVLPFSHATRNVSKADLTFSFYVKSVIAVALAPATTVLTVWIVLKEELK